MMHENKILRILTFTFISLVGAIILFQISLRLLNFYFPAIIIIDNQEEHLMPIGNILWSFFASFILFIILLFRFLKKNNPEIRNLSNIQKQILATKCFSQYCVEKEISHEYIDELIKHLLSIQNTKDFPLWEGEGAKLKLSGRGDELPNEIELILKTKDKKTFLKILESTVEVGIINMYGGETTHPEIYLKKCISILNNNNISIPKLEL